MTRYHIELLDAPLKPTSVHLQDLFKICKQSNVEFGGCFYPCCVDHGITTLSVRADDDIEVILLLLTNLGHGAKLVEVDPFAEHLTDFNDIVDLL